MCRTGAKEHWPAAANVELSAQRRNHFQAQTVVVPGFSPISVAMGEASVGQRQVMVPVRIRKGMDNIKESESCHSLQLRTYR